MDKKVKIGIIGCGNIARTHLRSYSKDDRVEIYAFCDLEIDKAEEMAREFGVDPQGRTFADVEDMVKLEELDAVSVCTWNNTHALCAIAALKAGKHVLCEKPMSVNASLAADMIRAQEESGKHLQIGFVRRFGDDCKLLKEFNENGFFGDIYYAKVKNLRRHGAPGGWFIDKKRSGGGPLIDLGVHIIDLMCFILGEDVRPVSVYAATFRKLGSRPELRDSVSYVASRADKDVECDIEDLASAMIRFSNGTVLTAEVSFELNQTVSDDTSIEIFGSKGGARVGSKMTLCSVVEGRLANVELSAESGFDFHESFSRETKHFIDCILDPSIECRAPASAGLKMMKIIDAVYKSAETGHEELIPW